jgi:hypothetical protein
MIHAVALVAVLDELLLEHDLAEWQEISSKQDGQWDTCVAAGPVPFDEQARGRRLCAAHPAVAVSALDVTT